MASPQQQVDDEKLIELFELGEKHYRLYKEAGNPVELHAAYNAWRSLDDLAPKNWPYRPELDYNLGLALRCVARTSRDEIICQKAIDKFKAARGSGAFDRERMALLANELAVAYAEAFNLTNSRDHLSLAIDSLRQAVSLSQPASDQCFERKTSLGRLLLRRHAETRQSSDLLSSLELLVSSRQTNKRLFESLPGASESLCRAVEKGAQCWLIGPYLPVAIAIAEETLAGPGLATAQRAQWLLTLARCLFSRLRESGNEGHKDYALRLMSERLELLTEDRDMGRFLPAIRRMPAQLRDRLFEIYLSHHNAADLDAAIDAIPELHSALYADPRNDEEALQAKWLEGMTSHENYKNSLAVDDLRKAALAYDALLKMPLLRASAAILRCIVLQSAAEAYFDLYWCTGDLDLLDLTIQIAREAYADSMHVKSTIIDTPRRNTTSREALFPIELGLPLIAQNLGMALGEAHLRTGDLDILEEAIKYCREALTLQSPWFDPGLDGGDVLHSSLGSVLRYGYRKSGESKDIAEAIWHQQKAVELAREYIERSGRYDFVDGELKVVPPSPDRLASTLNNLGTALRERYEQTHSEADLAEAVKCHREAMALSSKRGPNYLHYVSNLFDDLDSPYGLPDDGIGREELFAIAHANEDAPAHQVVTLNADLGRLAFRERNWSQAAECFRRAAKARDKLASIQMRFAAKTLWLSKAQGITAANAFALAKLERREEAAMVFEAGLATTISYALKWSHIQLDRVRLVDPTLARELLDSRTKLRGLEAPRESWMGVTGGMDGVGAAFSRREAWRALKEMEIESEKRIGSENWSLAASLGRIREALLVKPERALVYVAATDLGSLSLILTFADVETSWAKMTNLDIERTIQLRNDKGLSFSDFQSHGGGGFDSLLTTLLTGLGESLMAPCAEILRRRGIKQVYLVPVGHLALLPLHASTWQFSGKTTSLLDDFEVSYLPNAAIGIAQGAATPAGRSFLDHVIAFGNPRPSRLPYLRSAEAEVEAIRRVLRRNPPQCFIGGAATREAFIQCHQDGSLVHFAGHGIFDAENAINSCLIFSNDESLSITDFMGYEVRPRRGSVAVLSGCRTAAVESESVPDESLGLPASLLVAGFSEVIGSLWSIEDRATALLMVRFYELLEADALSPSQALRLATIWLRDASVEILNDSLAAHDLRAEPFMKDMVMKERPSLWTAFVHSGIF